MDERFAQLTESLHPAYERLHRMAPLTNGELPRSMPKSGVYLFSEGDKPMYVGRSNNLRARYGRHCLPGATHRMAAFAFKLAREITGRVVASYKSDENSRANLMLDDAFRGAFNDAKIRIRKMDYRYVEEVDQNRQALLEIYVTVVLGTPYNDFNTH
ncbi:hypothetical protein [Rhizobium sp. Root1220]|uniref:hypothetical protein n=1 Tax=Rhizobium sp. Root1220 TaxID=1736432 RepID=UPI000B2DF2AB|nr:hypothetical protein [Rhizobium sp. Root1220]